MLGKDYYSQKNIIFKQNMQFSKLNRIGFLLNPISITIKHVLYCNTLSNIFYGYKKVFKLIE